MKFAAGNTTLKNSHSLCPPLLKNTGHLATLLIPTTSTDTMAQGLNKDEVDFDGTWKILSTAFREIHCKNASQLSFEELFRNAYKLVLKKRQEELYDNVVGLERNWLRDEVRSRIVSLVSPAMLVGIIGEAPDTQANERRTAGERFMRSLKDAFADQQLCIGMITDVLMYMVSPITPIEAL